MGKTVVKDEAIYGPFSTLLREVDVYENCSFYRACFIFNSESANVVFKNCSFYAGDHFDFVLFEGLVRFENCTFHGLVSFNGTIYEKGKIKFNKCKGLMEPQFEGLKSRNQTLTEMGLYQTFKDRVLRRSKEETVYKKIGIYDREARTLIGFAIATLKIPKGTIRYGDRNGKCRCEKAIVTDIETYGIARIYSKMYADTPFLFKHGSVRDGGLTVYEVGKEIKPNFFDYIPNKCSYGIHYFYDREAAEAYDFS